MFELLKVSIFLLSIFYINHDYIQSNCRFIFIISPGTGSYSLKLPKKIPNFHCNSLHELTVLSDCYSKDIMKNVPHSM